MPTIAVNYLAIVVAAIAGFLVSWGWYALLGHVSRPAPPKAGDGAPAMLLPLIIAGVADLVMAWTLAGLLSHLGDVTIKGGIVSAIFVWIGFVVTTVGVNQVFQGKPPAATAVDTGNWLVVLIVMGIIIGAFGM